MKALRKTKIIATVGPSTATYTQIKKLVNAGMNVMRINFSHGKYEEHLEKINIINRICQEENIYIPIMLDTRGPEIRTGLFENDGVTIKTGSTFRISMEEVLGNEKKFSVSFKELFDDVKVKDIIRIDDGNFECEITSKDQATRELVCKAKNTHFIKSRKGVNVPAARLSMPFISKQDEEDLKFGCDNDVNYVAASFVRRRQDVIDLRAILKKYGKPKIQIIAKIENPEGVKNINEILEEADGIMVARGDLGVEVPAEIVPVIQKDLVLKARKLGKPVITATQMLDSMQTHPRPTRAEVSDVATAVSESTDAVMLSAETASGDYPSESVEMQAKIAVTTEKFLDYKRLAEEAYYSSDQDNNDAIANSIANTAVLIGAKLIVSFSKNGNSAMRLAKARPIAPILAFTDSRRCAFKLGLIWGLYNVVIGEIPTSVIEMTNVARQYAYELDLKRGDTIIVTGSNDNNVNTTDFMEILKL